MSSYRNNEREQPFLCPLDPAIQLFQLRQMQSYAYQTLFQSCRETMQQPWQTIKCCLNEMFLWVERMPNVIRRPMKKLLRSELLFASILLLSPNLLTGAFDVYAKALSFTYAYEYAEIMSSLSGELEKFAFYTSHDMSRCLFVATRLMDILRETSCELLNKGMPEAPQNDRTSLQPPPPLPNWKLEEISYKAIECLNRLEIIIEFFELKYNSTEQSIKYKKNFEKIKNRIEK